MSIKLNHTNMNELASLHEKLASAFRISGLTGDALDKAICAALTPSLIEIENDRATKADRRSKLRVVEED